jgi:plasmid stability protein
MTADKPGNLANLQAAAAARTAAATARAEAALNQMVRGSDTITFRALAATAGVSLDFLYRNTVLRDRITHLRDRQQAQPATTRALPPAPDQPSVIATLTAQLADAKRRHREETTELRRALQAAHGENLLLRRRAGQGPAGPGPATTAADQTSTPADR